MTSIGLVTIENSFSLYSSYGMEVSEPNLTGFHNLLYTGHVFFVYTCQLLMAF